MPRTRRLAAAVGVTAVALTAVAVHSRADGRDWSSKHPAPHAVGELAAGFHAPDVKTFYSSQVVTPDPETWTRIRPSGDYRVLLLAAGKDSRTPADPQVGILVKAAERWAEDEGRVQLKVEYLSDPTRYIQRLDDAATRRHADLIVTAGNALVAPVAVVSANYAGYHPQQFLVLGAEVAEPTTNIAATDWAGSAYIGEGLDEELYYDPPPSPRLGRTQLFGPEQPPSSAATRASSCGSRPRSTDPQPIRSTNQTSPITETPAAMAPVAHR